MGDTEELVMESLEASAMESVSDTASLEELAMESELDTVFLEELAMVLLEELGSALEECTTGTPDTTEPPSSTLLSLVRMLVANESFCKRDITILYIEMKICPHKKK